MKPQIELALDHVRIELTLVPRPDHMSRSEWEDFWRWAKDCGPEDQAALAAKLEDALTHNEALRKEVESLEDELTDR